MKNLQKNKALIIIFILAALGLVLALIFQSSGNVPLEPKGEKITVSQNGREITVYENGAVIYVNADASISREVWSLEKTAAFFDYYNDLYQGTGAGEQNIENGNFVEIGGARYVVIDDDELSGIIVGPEDTGTGSNGGSSGAGDLEDDLSNYFDDDDDDDEGQGSGDSSGSGSSEEEEVCLFWRLSYCVTFPTATPVPNPTATPGPGFEALPPTCEEILNQETGRTVISNELCVADPTATP